MDVISGAGTAMVLVAGYLLGLIIFCLLGTRVLALARVARARRRLAVMFLPAAASDELLAARLADVRLVLDWKVRRGRDAAGERCLYETISEEISGRDLAREAHRLWCQSQLAA